MSVFESTRKNKDLIYDMGMHKGEDTDFYLKKGFRVIGFEADPYLVEHCRSRFSAEIENGKLVIVEGAITELSIGKANGRTVKFYRNKDKSIWGTVVDEWAQRNIFLGTSCEIIEVAIVDIPECFRKYGIPHYLKIDIEGCDTVCLMALINFEQKPDYISIESEKVSFFKLLREFDLLRQLGYSRFKAVQQQGISKQMEPNPSKEGHYIGYKFQEGASGLFGEDLPYLWKSYWKILYEYIFIFIQYKLFGDFGKLNKYQFSKHLKRKLSRLMHKPVPGWYDTHAKHFSIDLYNGSAGILN